MGRFWCPNTREATTAHHLERREPPCLLCSCLKGGGRGGGFNFQATGGAGWTPKGTRLDAAEGLQEVQVWAKEKQFTHLHHAVGGDHDVELGQEGGVFLAVGAVVLVDLQLTPGQAGRLLGLRKAAWMSEKRARLSWEASTRRTGSKEQSLGNRFSTGRNNFLVCFVPPPRLSAISTPYSACTSQCACCLLGSRVEVRYCAWLGSVMAEAFQTYKRMGQVDKRKMRARSLQQDTCGTNGSRQKTPTPRTRQQETASTARKRSQVRNRRPQQTHQVGQNWG